MIIGDIFYGLLSCFRCVVPLIFESAWRLLYFVVVYVSCAVRYFYLYQSSSTRTL